MTRTVGFHLRKVCLLFAELIRQSALVGVCVVVFFSLLFVRRAGASFGDLDCSDFGTRERAQYEFDQMDFDRYGLDRDGDNLVCEWNPSARFTPWIIGGLAFAVGVMKSMFKLDPERRVPWSQALTHRRRPKHDKDWNVIGHEIKFDGDHLFEVLIGGWLGGLVAWFVAVLARDRVLPRSASPVLVVSVAALAGVLLGYGVNHLFERKRYR